MRTPYFNHVNQKDANTRARNPEEWLVPGFIPNQALVILASAPKVGKTVFATVLARALAKGESFLGTPLNRAKVAWCAHEEFDIERQPLHKGITDEDPFYIRYPFELPFIDEPADESGIPYVYQHCLAEGIKLLVIDCLHAAVKHSNLADNQTARRVVGRLRHFTAMCGVSTLLLHHVTKSTSRSYLPERFADSSQILAASNAHFFLDRIGSDERPRRYTLHGFGRHPAPNPVTQIISPSLLEWELAPKPIELKPATLSDRILDAIAEQPGTVQEIAERLDAPHDTVRITISRLVKAGQLFKQNPQDKKPTYDISELMQEDV